MEVADLHLACLFCTQNCYNTHGEGKPLCPNVPAFWKEMTIVNLSKDTIEPVLELPSAFVKEYGHQLDKISILEGPSGQTWPVDVCGSKSNMSFKKGWNTFSTDHDLCEGDIVFFKLITKAYLTVQVFSKDGCEKDMYNVQNSVALALQSGNSPTQGTSTKRRYRQLKHEKVASVGDGVESKGCTPNFENRHRKLEGSNINLDMDQILTKNTQTQTCKEQLRKNLVHPPAIDLEVEDITSLQNLMDIYKIPSAVLCQENAKHSSIENGIGKTLCRRLRSSDARKGVFKKNLSEANISCVRSVPDAMLAANSHCGTYPTAIFQMKHSNVSHGFSLFVGRKFGEQTPKEDSRVYLVNSSGYRWEVKWLTQRGNLSGGWGRFALDHGLQVGDVCLFELTTEMPLTFNVHMFRCNLIS